MHRSNANSEPIGFSRPIFRFLFSIFDAVSA